MDFARSLVQHNREYFDFIRNGVPVEWRDAAGEREYTRAQVIDFRNGTAPDGTPNNRFLAVRELNGESGSDVGEQERDHVFVLGDLRGDLHGDVVDEHAGKGLVASGDLPE